MKVLILDIDGCLNVEVFINAFFYILKQAEVKRPEAKQLFKDIYLVDCLEHRQYVVIENEEVIAKKLK